MHALIQVLKVNDKRSGVSAKTGKPWEMQDAECIVLNDDLTPSKVGVLRVPRDLLGKVDPGVYTGSFSLEPDYQTRVIGAVLTGLVAVPDSAQRSMRSAALKTAAASGGSSAGAAS